MAAIYVATTGSDTNGGTSTADAFLTIPKAASVAVAGDVIHVLAGDYIGGFTATCAGSVGNPITFISDTLHGARLVHSAASTSSYAWHQQGANVEIKQFDIDGNTYNSGTRWRIGIHAQASNVLVERCFVHSIWDSSGFGSPGSNGGAGIMFNGNNGDSGCTANRNWVQSIGYSGNNNIHGIYVAMKQCFVYNNVVGAIGADGISLYHDGGMSVDVLNNTVFNCDRGIMVAAGGYYTISPPTQGCRIINNICYSNASQGVREYEDVAGDNGIHTYKNDCSWNNGTNYLLLNGTLVNCVSSDPSFVNYLGDGNGDYTLTAVSPCVDAGFSLTAITVDYSGNIRSAGAYDIGAFEYTPAPAPGPSPSPAPGIFKIFMCVP